MLRVIRSEGRLLPPFSSQRSPTSPNPRQENAPSFEDGAGEELRSLPDQKVFDRTVVLRLERGDHTRKIRTPHGMNNGEFF